jgi:hypothetical protein
MEFSPVLNRKSDDINYNLCKSAMMGDESKFLYWIKRGAISITKILKLNIQFSIAPPEMDIII